MSGDKHFNADKIFIALIVLTALEVAWGLAGTDWNKTMLWGGLLFCAFFKGWLIAVYFMHLKFEGKVIYSLILPTPFLVMVIMGYVGSDVANSDAPYDHPVGSMKSVETGDIKENLHDIWHAHAEEAEAPSAP